MNGIFTISLDFELHWGVFDKRSREHREKVYLNTLNLVPKMLKLFEKYGVNVTWATVGSMFAKNEKQWNELKAKVQPEYAVSKYSAYKWVHDNGLEDKFNWAHFAPDMIRKILDSPGQELATHTFSHYYCLEEQTETGAFESDLQAAQKAAALFETRVSSLVFPRNQFNPEYLRICFENGITVVRSNPANWFWNPVQDKGSSLVRKIIRTSDAYIQLGAARTSYPLSSILITPGEPIQLPASRFFRPWRNKYKFANRLRLRRMCKELKAAAINNECYHLWFHPENFGEHPEQNLANLEILLKEYQKCSNKYGMESWTMTQYAKHFNIASGLTENAYYTGYVNS